MWDLITLREINELAGLGRSKQDNLPPSEKFLVVGSTRKDYLDAARDKIMRQIEKTTGRSFKATKNIGGGIEDTLETQHESYMEADVITEHTPYSKIGKNMGFGGFNFGLYYRATQPSFGQEIDAIVRDVAQSHELNVINLSHVVRNLKRG